MRQIFSPLDGFRSPFGRLMGGTAPFTPAVLFASNEPGVWYDPSDLTTLFQDTAGTQPVTTPGQTVALALDKSKGLVLGSELVTNGDFSSGTTGWVSSSANISVVSGKLLVENSAATAGQARASAITTVVGRSYKVDFFVEPGTANPNFRIGSTLGSADIFDVVYTAPTTVSRIFVATTTLTYVAVRINSSTLGATVFADNISVKELPGFHATQATLASRPTYGIVPLGGRRNLLTVTDDLAATQWNVASNLTRTVGGGGTSSSGSAYTRLTATAGNTDHYLQGAGFALTSGVSYAISIEMQYVSHRWVGIAIFDGGFRNGATFDLLNGAIGTNLGLFSSRTITPLGGNRYRLSAVYTAVSTANAFFGIVMLDADKAFTTTTVSNLTATTVDAGRVQIETGSTATAYQRVGSAFDVTEAGVASLSYLSFDGVDDWLVTPTITPGIDRAQVFAGVRKLSDAAVGQIFAFGDTSANGTAYLQSSTTPGYFSGAKGNAAFNVGQRASLSQASPDTAVLSSEHDIAADLSNIRRNGVAGTSGTFDKGAGNFLAYALTIGRSAAASSPFNGNLFSLIVRFGTNLDAGTITSTETWVNSKTGAYT